MLRLAEIVRWKPRAPGAPATGLSLTADDGTWIKLPDFKDHLHVLLVFFRSLDEPTATWARRLDAQRGRFEALDCAVFGVNTSRTDTLRAWRQQAGIEFFLLYDPFAMAARGYRASGRVMPTCRDQVVIVGKDGTVKFSERGLPEVERLVDLVSGIEGRTAPPPVAPAPQHPVGDANLRTPGAMPAAVKDVDSNEAIALLGEADSPFVLVDVRTRVEIERERSPLARHFIAVDELPHRYAELGQTTHIVFVCQGGGRSAAAAEFMTSIGASHVYNVVGGMTDWQGPKISGPV
ncbi:MAG: redoxin domain-containing protein [Deltaproteobacteria bacterium]|nr:redoxin domain-containing protein [Deltaproteobacteria bacterium]